MQSDLNLIFDSKNLIFVLLFLIVAFSKNVVLISLGIDSLPSMFISFEACLFYTLLFLFVIFLYFALGQARFWVRRSTSSQVLKLDFNIFYFYALQDFMSSVFTLHKASMSFVVMLHKTSCLLFFMLYKTSCLMLLCFTRIHVFCCYALQDFGVFCCYALQDFMSSILYAL